MIFIIKSLRSPGFKKLVEGWKSSAPPPPPQFAELNWLWRWNEFMYFLKSILESKMKQKEEKKKDKGIAKNIRIMHYVSMKRGFWENSYITPPPVFIYVHIYHWRQRKEVWKLSYYLNPAIASASSIIKSNSSKKNFIIVLKRCKSAKMTWFPRHSEFQGRTLISDGRIEAHSKHKYFTWKYKH